MADIDWILLLSRWVHLGAAFAAVGGVVYARVAALPGVSEALDGDSAEKVREAMRRRWAKVTHACIALLLITGGINFVILAMPPKVEPMPYHAIFAVKFIAAMLIFFFATALVGRSAGLAKFRVQSRKWLSVIIVLGALVVLLSGLLNQVRTTQARNTPPAALVPPVE